MSEEITLFERIKQYLRIDGSEEDFILSSLIGAAKEYLKNAGIKENEKSDLYCLAVALYVSNQYENRVPNAIGKHAAKLSFSLESIIIQLQYSQKAEDIKEGDIKSIQEN
ncbi:phage gp6-like head-tail connector protein [Clostridium niameyense]|uniref:Phage gp6-like head-tail connector protein n=1 Tax=Clostridium niameyense TaxID=1622073 RepID=A0A6M0RCN0_9CLOT|nr:head-tail connector protein [Clostridium niameyense]NEZ47932.1 phage gp6-like head-tail connector protein [Clostridium niameyense]